MSVLQESNSASEKVFGLIGNIERFGNQQIQLITVNNNLWFKGNNIARILGYLNTSQAFQDNVDSDDKRPFSELLKVISTTDDLSTGYNKNELKTTYINESGLYSLILSSKLPAAKAFKKWVTSELLPRIRQIGQDKFIKQAEEQQKLLLECEQKYKEELKESQAQLNRLHTFNQELLTYKRLITKDETIYIVSTREYARQGIFKVGRTKTMMTARNSVNNTSHAPGDKVKVLAEFKVNNAVVVEKNIHQKLAGLRPSPDEHFLCPFDLLYDIIATITDNDASQCEAVNKLINTVATLRVKEFSEQDWTRRLDMSLFAEHLCIGIGEETKVLDEVTDWTLERKTEEVEAIFELYQTNRPSDRMERTRQYY
jgi:prophage antirepressor-like protein